MHHDIKIEKMLRRHVAAVKLRTAFAEMPSRMGDAFGAVMSFLQKAGIEAQAPAVAIYDEVTGDAVSAAVGFYVPARIDGDGHVVPAATPACEAAVTTHWGAYQTLHHAYAAMREWMQREGYEPAGSTMWEEYFSPPDTPPAQTRTDIYWPIQRLARRGRGNEDVHSQGLRPRAALGTSCVASRAEHRPGALSREPCS